MKQTLTQIVDTIIQKIQEQPERFRTESRIRSRMTNQGYTKHDIDAALQLVHSNMSGERVDSNKGPASMRHFAPYEQLKLSAEAQEALQRLDLYGLIEPYEREAILERLDQFDGEVDMPDLEYLISCIVCSTRDVEHQRTIYQVLEGKPDLLQ